METSVATIEEESGDTRARGVRPTAEMQQLWFACLRRPWSSLVVMPAHAEGSVLAVAQALAEIGAIYLNRPVKLFDARGLTVAEAAKVILEISPRSEERKFTVIPADSVLANHAGVPLCLAADAVLLVVDLANTEMASARRTIDLIGASRVIGVVARRPTA